MKGAQPRKRERRIFEITKDTVFDPQLLKTEIGSSVHEDNKSREQKVWVNYNGCSGFRFVTKINTISNEYEGKPSKDLTFNFKFFNDEKEYAHRESSMPITSAGQFLVALSRELDFRYRNQEWFRGYGPAGEGAIGWAKVPVKDKAYKPTDGPIPSLDIKPLDRFSPLATKNEYGVEVRGRVLNYATTDKCLVFNARDGSKVDIQDLIEIVKPFQGCKLNGGGVVARTLFKKTWYDVDSKASRPVPDVPSGREKHQTVPDVLAMVEIGLNGWRKNDPTREYAMGQTMYVNRLDVYIPAFRTTFIPREMREKYGYNYLNPVTDQSSRWLMNYINASESERANNGQDGGDGDDDHNVEPPYKRTKLDGTPIHPVQPVQPIEVKSD